MPLHFQNGKAVEKLVPASTQTVKVMGPQAVPERELHQILVYLASHGAFVGMRKSESAFSGNMFEDVWTALAHLGDATWLSGNDGYDKSAEINALRWIERYCRGLEVPSRNDEKAAPA